MKPDSRMLGRVVAVILTLAATGAAQTTMEIDHAVRTLESRGLMPNLCSYYWNHKGDAATIGQLLYAAKQLSDRIPQDQSGRVAQLGARVDSLDLAFVTLPDSMKRLWGADMTTFYAGRIVPDIARLDSGLVSVNQRVGVLEATVDAGSTVTTIPAPEEKAPEVSPAVRAGLPLTILLCAVAVALIL